MKSVREELLDCMRIIVRDDLEHQIHVSYIGWIIFLIRSVVMVDLWVNTSIRQQLKEDYE